jgi:hypothetical protein
VKAVTHPRRDHQGREPARAAAHVRHDGLAKGDQPGGGAKDPAIAIAGAGQELVEKVGVVAMERPKALEDDLDTVAFTRRGRDNISALHPYVPGVGMDSSTDHLGSRNLYIFESGVYS